jgi:disulfide bond formation protein DsbB
MLSKLASIGGGAWYWLALVVLGLSMEAVALTYQHVLEYLPCVLCIHVRIWVLAFILLALLTLFLRRSWPLLVTAHVLNTVIMVGLLERSWMLLGTERGIVEGTCGMDSGLPGWFALDVWFPTLFKVWEPCGYTPELLFGITMAEALLVFSAAMVLVSVTLTIATLLGKETGRP